MGFFNDSNCYIYKVEIHGMKCSMCESHINDVIRKNFEIKSVKSNHRKNLTIIKSKEELDVNKIKEVIYKTGYEIINIEKELK